MNACPTGVSAQHKKLSKIFSKLMVPESFPNIFLPDNIISLIDQC